MLNECWISPSSAIRSAPAEPARHRARSPAEESWANINAIDDVVQAIIATQDRFTVSALRGNAGAGGVFLALAADEVWMAKHVVANPHCAAY